jgi:hypothetical protein
VGPVVHEPLEAVGSFIFLCHATDVTLLEVHLVGVHLGGVRGEPRVCTIACYMSHLSLGLGSVEKIGLLVSQVESSQVLSININRYVTLGIKQE